MDLSVYFILDPSLCKGRDELDVAERALRGGVTMLQYRDKNNPNSAILQNALKLKRILNDVGRPVTFLINDYVDIALESGADGVHLGQGDMDPAAVRRALGPDKTIGLTAFTEAQIRAVDPSIVDYIGTGPVYPTHTDKGKPVLGVGGFAVLAALSPVPVVGIGGITPENAPPVLQAGAAGVAMMRSISEADDPEAAARRFAGLL